MTTDGLTIIVPTRNEADNVGPLLAAIRRQPLQEGAHVLFIDDSDDTETVPAIRRLQRTVVAIEIDVVHRPAGERTNQLAGAVVHGIDMARRRAPTGTVVVMDGDLQHPPSVIPTMLAAMRERQADIVVASRYRPGGCASGLDGPLRHAVSRACTWLVKLMFYRRLRGVTDPMTGCFAVRVDCLETVKLRAGGFKILLEVLVSHPDLRKAEVPIRFAKRERGESKGTFDNGMRFLRQISRLALAT